jgi:hypothetical protein
MRREMHARRGAPLDSEQNASHRAQRSAHDAAVVGATHRRRPRHRRLARAAQQRIRARCRHGLRAEGTLGQGDVARSAARRGARGTSRGRARGGLARAARRRGQAAAVAARRQAHALAERSSATRIRGPSWCALCASARPPERWQCARRWRAAGAGKTTHSRHTSALHATRRRDEARGRGATLSTRPVCVGRALREAPAKREHARCRAGAAARSGHDPPLRPDHGGRRRRFRPCAPARRAPRPGHAPPHAPLALASPRRARRSRQRPCNALARGELVLCTLS